MGSMKVHQLARGLCWDQQEVPSLTLGCKRLRPLAPKQIILTTSPPPPPPNFDLKTFIRPDSGPRNHLLPHSPKKDNNNPPPSPQQQVETHPGGTRWNPTQEQIGILEMLYRGGMRTPNAEQIEQITGQLSKYGKIEGKNVFYWFQNHKARERQKQKRNTMATEEEGDSSPYKKRCRRWPFEGLLLEHTTMPMPMPMPSHTCTDTQQQRTTTLELFPLHPEGR